jgi:hypothetical protein
MLESKLLRQTEPDPPIRTLKIEAEGDFWKGHTKPKIRLIGRWLERAVFNPCQQVQVTCVAPGVIELRVPDALAVKELQAASPERCNCSLR